MATAESLKDEHLTCSICYMPFTQPKTLQCLHTFCQECLQHHINHVAGCRGIPCPVCRHVTVLEVSTQPRQRWSQLIKTDFKLAGILEALHQMEREKATHGDTIVVTSSLSPSNDRKTQLTTMLQLLRPAVSFIQGKMEEENQRLLTMRDTRSRTEKEVRCFFRQLTDALKVKEMKLLDDLTAIHEIGRNESEENHKRYTTLVEETSDTIGLIDRLLSPGSEYATLECLPRIQKQQEKIMRFVSDPPTCSSSIQFSFRANLNNSLSVVRGMDVGSISTTSQLSSENLTLELKTDLKSSKGSHDKRDISVTTLPSYTAVGDCMNQSVPLITSHDEPSTLPSGQHEVSIHMASASTPGPYLLEATLETKAVEDSYVPQLKNIVILQGKAAPAIIVLDYDNASLKAFSKSEDQMITFSHRFSGYPQSLAKFTDDKVIVSLMNYKFIVFTSDLKQVSNIESDKWYSSLATHTVNEKLFGFVNTTTTFVIGGRLNDLEQLNLKGKLINKLTNPSSNEDHFADISYICLTSDSKIVVCDNVNCTVACVSMEGELVWRMDPQGQHHIDPAGVASDSAGHLFVVDKHGKRVVKVDERDGMVIGEVLTRENGLDEPIAVAVDSRNRIYVTQHNGIIRVYSL